MAFDAGNIFQTYLQGANFVAGSLERAENRRRQQEEDELQSIAGKGLEIFAPKYDKDGRLLPRTSGDIFNDPATLELANHPYMKAARMQGITDPRVKDVRYVGGSPLEDGKHVVPIVEQLDEDGTVISRGPLTEGRSRDGSAMVTPITVDTMFNHLAGEVYRRNPALGEKLLTRANQQALGGLRTQYRNAQSDAEREQLVQIWSSYGGTPDDLTKNSGTPVTKQRLDGTVEEIKPGGSTTVRFDPEVAKVGDQVAAKETENLVKRQSSLSEGRLTFDEANNDRQLKLDADKITNQYETQLRNKLAHSEDELRLESARIVNNYVTNLGLDKQYAGEKLKLLTEEIIARVKATAGANYEAAPTVKKTNEVLNPVDAQNEQGLLQAREFFKAKPIEQVTQDDVLTQGKNLDRPGLLGLRAGLLARIERHDASAGRPLASVNALLNQSEGGGGSGGKEPGAPSFKKDELKGYLKDRVPDEVADSAALNGEVKFRKAIDTLGALGLPIPKDSVGSAIVNRVVGNEFILQHNGVLSDSGVDDAFPALWSWEAVAQKTNPNDAEDPAKAQAYVRDVFLPITQELKANGLPSTFEKSHAVALDVAHLQKVGLGAKDAIREAIKLEKDPKYAEEVLAASKRDNKPAYEIVKEWSKKDVRSLSSADLSGKRQTLSSPAMRGFSTLYPELNPR